MANVTRDVAVTKSAYIRNAYPTTHYGTNGGTNYLVGTDATWYGAPENRLLFGIGAWPASLKRNRLISAKIRVYVQVASMSLYASMRNNFDAGSVTWNTQPDTVRYSTLASVSASTLALPEGTWSDIWIDLTADQIEDLLQGTAFALYSGQYASGQTPWYAKVVLAGGGTPYVRVTYSDSEIETCKATLYSKLSNNADPTVANSLSWRLASKNGYNCFDNTWTQSSAKFYWRVSGGSWKSINVSGSTTSFAVPANTFPAGKTIEYYVAVTETGGTTVNTDTATFTTKLPTLSVTGPASNADNRTAKAWNWTLRFGSTDYTQASAKLFWRVSGAETWNSISVSGNTKTLSVPGYTFPSGSTIQWYLTSTDKDGNTITSATYSFTTLAPVLTVTSAPSGNDYDSRGDTVFMWTLKNSSGDYTQASAKLYWRASSASTYNEVSISGNVKSCTVPGYTFPANSTIQWYLSATDSSGITKTTNAATFKTAAVSLKMTGNPSGSNYDPRNSTLFTWSLYNANGEYTQESATLYWRVGTSGAWHEISISGNTKNCTVPANTFPTGSSIQWYLSATGKADTAHSTNTASFSTLSPKITAVTYPSGNSVESGQPLTFSWAFKSGQVEYDQASAALHWRASTADPWQTISASGSTTSLTVPKNTFPGNATTIYWYLSGTDTGGCSSETSASSFRTVTSQITPQNSPTSGYRDPRNAITFSWYFKTAKASYDQASAVFHWRISGSEAWTDVAASGSTGSVTIPANTFPVASTIEWYLSGEDVGGCASESEIYSFSTAAGTSYAICQAPVGRVEDGTKEITFLWTVRNSDGSVPSRTVLEWKLPTESSWHTILDTTQEVYSYTLAAYTLVAGPVEWRVQTYNRDDVAGPADSASFVVLRAPEPPAGLSASNVPLSTIRWQSEDQGAYEITIDGVIVAAEYGPTVYSWQVPEPLEDGVHSILIRIQGKYGLWSNYAETSVLIANEPEGTLELSGIFNIDADLTATPTDIPEVTAIQWYRDGKHIGQTAGKNTFTDRFAIGRHRYYAEVWLNNENYVRSNTVEGVMETHESVIAEADGGEWIRIHLSDNSNNTDNFTWSKNSVLQHITAAKYPILEMSENENLEGSFVCSFADMESEMAFLQLRGKVVVLKSRRGHIVIGGFTGYNLVVPEFYATYSFTIQQTDWEDFVDDKDS